MRWPGDMWLWARGNLPLSPLSHVIVVSPLPRNSWSKKLRKLRLIHSGDPQTDCHVRSDPSVLARPCRTALVRNARGGILPRTRLTNWKANQISRGRIPPCMCKRRVPRFLPSFRASGILWKCHVSCRATTFSFQCYSRDHKNTNKLVVHVSWWTECSSPHV